MSKESARFFLDRVNRDKGFARCFDGVDSPDTLMEIVRRWGYDFTVEDLKYAVVSVSNMSDEELAYVSGGAGAASPWRHILEVLGGAGSFIRQS